MHALTYPVHLEFRRNVAHDSRILQGITIGVPGTFLLMLM